jgi:AraC-like DNA-binding protein
MPRLTARPLFRADQLQIRRVTCDGVDEAHPADEGVEDARVILVARGRFTFQDAGGRGIASPAVGLFLPDGHTYRIRHIDGGDICVALQGEICRALVEAGPVLRRVPTTGYICTRDLAARLARGEPFTRLAVEEILTSALTRPSPPVSGSTSRARSVAEAIAYELERDVDARLTLDVVARKAGVSIFHACRVFKQMKGLSIHRYHQEIRLHHALAWLLDTDRSIAEIAVECGFANQGHFTNVFRRRFRTTPGCVRATGGRGLISRVS